MPEKRDPHLRITTGCAVCKEDGEKVVDRKAGAEPDILGSSANEVASCDKLVKSDKITGCNSLEK